MSKAKISFSLFFALLLVGILSSAVFAASSPSVKASQTGTNAVITLSNEAANTQYYYGLTVGGVAPTQFTAFTSPASGSATVLAPLTAAQSGQTVTVTIYSDQGTTVYAGPSTAFTVYLKSNQVINANPNNNVDSLGLTNSNGTGTGGTPVTGGSAKHANRSGQSMHGFYQNNTNSCASCHQAHTADPSTGNDALLFKDGVYSTCSACHDGTTGGDNSWKAPTASTVSSVDGTFDVEQLDATTGVNENGSMHQADGSLQISAAPGGNSSPSGTYGSATWGSEFDCASCHNPHGGGSTLTTSTGTIKNENNLNEDPLGWGKVPFVSAANGGTGDQQNGKLFIKKNIVPFANIPTTETDSYILVSATAGQVNSNLSNVFASNKTNGFLYGAAGITSSSTPVIQTYRWNGTSYVPDYSLWLKDTGHESAPFTASNTVLYSGTNGTGTDITNTGNGSGPITVAWQNGFAYGAGVADVQSYTLSVGINVEGTANDAAAYYDNTDPNYVPYSGTEMSLYCASCHTDYLSAGATKASGVYATAYRHRTDEDSLSCVRCHFAHGSDAQIMQDANNNSFWNLSTTNPDGVTANTNTYTSGPLNKTNMLGTSPNGTAVNTMSAQAALSYLADPNPSSAIKRYTGMTACYGCHGSGDQFMGDPNTTVDSTTGQGVFAGHTGDEGSTGSLGGSRPNNATRH